MQQWQQEIICGGATVSDLKVENVLPIPTDRALQAFSLDMRRVDEPMTIGLSSIDPACQASPVYTQMPADRGGVYVCFVDKLEGKKGNSVVLGILFLCLDFFFSHVSKVWGGQRSKTYLL